MSGDSGDHIEIRPLTKVNASGEPYYRRDEVEEQLREAVCLSADEISHRLAFPNKATPGYLFDETLVYLFREAHRREDLIMQNLIYDHLAVRVEMLLRKHASQVDVSKREDFIQGLHLKLLKKISDHGSDKADYAQVMFGDYVTTLANSDKRGFWNRKNKDSRNVEIDAPNEEGHDFDPRDESLSHEDIATLNDALGRLPADTATAYLMHFRDGIQIESGDPDEPTVARHFGVSGRTIRNWFAKAVRTLASDDGGER